jgi:hypothetical protein
VIGYGWACIWTLLFSASPWRNNCDHFVSLFVVLLAWWEVPVLVGISAMRRRSSGGLLCGFGTFFCLLPFLLEFTRAFVH